MSGGWREGGPDIKGEQGRAPQNSSTCRHSTRFGCETPKFKDKPDFPPTTTALRVQCLGAQESPALSSLGLAKALALPWGVFFPARCNPTLDLG